jgi:hypothetical protein
MSITLLSSVRFIHVGPRNKTMDVTTSVVQSALSCIICGFMLGAHMNESTLLDNVMRGTIVSYTTISSLSLPPLRRVVTYYSEHFCHVKVSGDNGQKIHIQTFNMVHVGIPRQSYGHKFMDPWSPPT